VRFNRNLWFEADGAVLFDTSWVTATGEYVVSGVTYYDNAYVGDLNVGDFVRSIDGTFVEITGIDRYNYVGGVKRFNLSGYNDAFICHKDLNIYAIDDAYIVSGATRVLATSGDMASKSVASYLASGVPESGGLFYAHSIPFERIGAPIYWADTTKVSYSNSGAILPIITITDGYFFAPRSASRIFTSGDASFIVDGFAIYGY